MNKISPFCNLNLPHAIFRFVFRILNMLENLSLYLALQQENEFSSRGQTEFRRRPNHQDRQCRRHDHHGESFAQSQDDPVVRGRGQGSGTGAEGQGRQ